MSDHLYRDLKVHADDRGDVREIYRASWGVPPVVQMVRSYSRAGTIRAMHAHKQQWDVWNFISGRALVQLYDHREWGGWSSARVMEQGEALLIPPGVSHGFQALEDCLLVYGLTREYDGTDEFEWNAFDPEWPGAELWAPPPTHLTSYIRSDRDRQAPSLAEFAAKW